MGFKVPQIQSVHMQCPGQPCTFFVCVQHIVMHSVKMTIMYFPFDYVIVVVVSWCTQAGSASLSYDSMPGWHQVSPVFFWTYFCLEHRAGRNQVATRKSVCVKLSICFSSWISWHSVYKLTDTASSRADTARNAFQNWKIKLYIKPLLSEQMHMRFQFSIPESISSLRYLGKRCSCKKEICIQMCIDFWIWFMCSRVNARAHAHTRTCTYSHTPTHTHLNWINTGE